jgi:hypothetical protein
MNEKEEIEAKTDLPKISTSVQKQESDSHLLIALRQKRQGRGVHEQLFEHSAGRNEA